MAEKPSYLQTVRQQTSNRYQRLVKSRALRIVGVVALVAAIFVPAVIPLVALSAIGAAAYPLAASLIGPALPSRMPSLVPSFLRSGGRSGKVRQPKAVSQPPRQKQPSRRYDERHGKNTGDPLTDALVTRLRDNKLRVSTDWKEAKAVLRDLPDKYNLLKKKNSKVYGFVYAGVTYINPQEAKADVPVHEYTHIWAEVLRQNNPEEWQNIVSLMKQEKDLWNKVVKAYPHLENDDEIADEVLATYSGIHGRQRLQEQCEPGRSVEDVFKFVLQALEKFWKNVAMFFDKSVHYETKEDIADRVLSDFLTGVNPLAYAQEGKERLSDRKPLKAMEIDINTKKENNMENKPDMSSEKRAIAECRQTVAGLSRELFNVVQDAKNLDMRDAFGAYFILDRPVKAVNDLTAPKPLQLEEGSEIVGMFLDRERTVPGDYLLYKDKEGNRCITSFGFINKSNFQTLIDGFRSQRDVGRLLPIVGREVKSTEGVKYTLTAPQVEKPVVQHVFEYNDAEGLDAAATSIDFYYRRALDWVTPEGNIKNISPVIPKKTQDVIERLLQHDPEYRHMILGRMKSDCDYAINWGDFHAMWMPDREGQIAVMKALHDSFDADQKPVRLTMEDIEVLDRKMQLSEQYTDIGVAVPKYGDVQHLDVPRNCMYYGLDGRIRTAEVYAVENQEGSIYAKSKDGVSIRLDNVIASDKRHLQDAIRRLYIEREMLSRADVDLSQYDKIPYFARSSDATVFKLTKGGKDIDMPVITAVIDGERVTRQITRADFSAYFRTVDSQTGKTAMSIEDLAGKYLGGLPEKRGQRMVSSDTLLNEAYRDNLLNKAVPKTGDYFRLPEDIHTPSKSALNVKDDFLDNTTCAVFNKDGVIYVGYDDNIVLFTDLSKEDQAAVLKALDESLYSLDVCIIQNPSQYGTGNVSVCYYQDAKAKAVLEDILAHPTENGEGYPLHPGSKGYYEDKGKFVAFDNETCSCFVEEFFHASTALDYLEGRHSVDDLRQRPEEVESRGEFYFKESVKAVIDRITDPRAKSLTTPQRIMVQNYISMFSDEPQKLWAAGHIYSSAIEDAAVKRVPSAWKADVREELKDLALGKVREQQSQGLKR